MPGLALKCISAAGPHPRGLGLLGAFAPCSLRSRRVRTEFFSTLLFLLTMTEPSLERLRAAVAEAAEKSTGEMGVAIEHLESGLRLDVRGDAAFPMASTFKLPLLVTLFHEVDEGKVRLDEMVSLERGDVHIGSGRLDDFAAPGISLSIANLAALMMRVSDNSAALSDQ